VIGGKVERCFAPTYSAIHRPDGEAVGAKELRLRSDAGSSSLSVAPSALIAFTSKFLGLADSA
jgi:hypothetical protein